MCVCVPDFANVLVLAARKVGKVEKVKTPIT